MKKIIFVCTGNTCRSPLAESYAKKVYPEREFESRGLMVTSDCISKYSLEIIRENALLEPSSPRQLSKSDTLQSVLLVMTEAHRTAVENMYPGAEVELLSKFSTEHSVDISDPFGAEKEVYNKVFQEIKTFVDKIEV